MNEFIKLEECLCCGNKNLSKYLDLRSQPLANNYHDNTKIQQEFELGVNICNNCWHSQLTVSVNPDILFKHYLYVSGTTKTLIEYFKSFAEMVTKTRGKTGKVLEIACNDGSQLEAFEACGWKTKGVDPAENIAKITKAKGLDVVCDYWGNPNLKLSEKYDVIVAQNVFAHVNNPYQFIKCAQEVLEDDGQIYIQTSQSNMITNGEFDTIYHEHISFFSAKSMKTLVERAGMFVQKIFKTPIHGVSYVFVIGKKQKNEDEVQYFIEAEELEQRYKEHTYVNFGISAEKTVDRLRNTLKEYKDKGFEIAGYGAAAKGNVLLNFGQVQLDYIIDDNPLKQGLYTPGMNIPIFSSDRLKMANYNLVVVPLSWNFFAEIKTRVQAVRNQNKTVFVKYFPRMEIIEE